MKDFKVGDIIRAHYNSGTYIGEIIEDRGNRFLVEVLAVDKHPVQGDLHSPKQVQGVAFHERKALAYREKMNAKKPATFAYEGEVPEYAESLKKAVGKIRTNLKKEDTEYNQKALEKIADLEEHYYNKVYAAFM
ncbi:kinase-associated lipoprotein B [Virgibacillus sp. MSJ-26]|uniref:kinase-associated lipoprotein B n=1 Tax=Virgibacillus sp. MSJ-26 TaxID=2841522 RepID=UPI001C115E5E|nr:kinase-associated lipoprotein B [Virgibacillus sp. MSJ-26]MBU5467222.1 kinase-associated lipoprotein B [Virgibacillus sp. MSJ-26]